MRTYHRLLPVLLLGLGVVSFLLSTRFDGGFVMGLFQGATLALVVGGGYLLWVLVFRPTDTRTMWRPSEDARHGDRG